MQTKKSKGKGEPGKNLSCEMRHEKTVDEQMNSPTLYGYSFCCKSFMDDRMGLGNTTLHYLEVHQAMVSIFRV